VKKGGANLLRDLAAVLQRYPLPEWARLANLLEQQETRSEVIQFLRRIADGGRSAENDTVGKNRTVAAPRPKPRVQDINAKNKRSEWVELELSRQAISDLRELLRNCSVPFSPKDSKQRLISKFLRSGRAGGDTLAIRNLGRRGGDPSDYAQWAEIIMGRNKRQNQR
jgi:hypothetical protein